MRDALTTLTGLCAAVLLTACGGGSYSANPDVSPAPPSTTEVPSTAGISSSALVGYLGTMTKSETAEPLSVAKVAPTSSETEEPLAVSK